MFYLQLRVLNLLNNFMQMISPIDSYKLYPPDCTGYKSPMSRSLFTTKGSCSTHISHNASTRQAVSTTVENQENAEGILILNRILSTAEANRLVSLTSRLPPPL